MLLSAFGLMRKSEVCGLASYTNECEERLNQYEAALEEIAAQVTPGANATVKRMGKIALDALNFEVFDITIEDVGEEVILRNGSTGVISAVFNSAPEVEITCKSTVVYNLASGKHMVSGAINQYDIVSFAENDALNVESV